MDFGDLVDYTVLQPPGERTCECACGCPVQLLPEEDALCSNCARAIHFE